jgi:hypothetical protein
MPALDPNVTEACLDGTCEAGLDEPCPKCGGTTIRVDPVTL